MHYVGEQTLNMIRRIDVRITRNLVVVLSVFLSFFIFVRTLPIREADKVKEREKRGSSTPCFAHSDCLRTQSCAWNPAVVELVGTCVTLSQYHGSRDQRYRVDERSGRTRRKALSFNDDNDVDERKVHRQARNVNFGNNERHRGGGNERRRKDHPYANGEVDKTDITRQNVEEKEEDPDYFGALKNDKQNAQSQLARRLPQASYPLSHKLPDKSHNHDDDINGDDEMVIDHFDDKGLPVVVISEDNRNQHAEIDTSKDFYTFGEEVGDNNPDTNLNTESIVYDYVDGSEVDGGHDGEREEVVIDLKGERIHPGIQSMFSNPWGLQPIKTIPKPVDDMLNDDEEYLNDDVQVYGVGDHRHVEPRFRHTDLTGTGIETDVGVDNIGDRQPVSRLTAADHTVIALPGLLTKDLDAHNY